MSKQKLKLAMKLINLPEGKSWRQQVPEHDFADVGKMSVPCKGELREVDDYHLSRVDRGV